MFRWFSKKIKRREIAGAFSLELLSHLNKSSKLVTSIRERCDRIESNDELTEDDLRIHAEFIKYAMLEIEQDLLVCINKIERERQ